MGLDAPDDCAVVDYNAASLHGGGGDAMNAFVKSPGGGSKVGTKRQPVHVVHSVDFFRSFIGDPYVFGQVSSHATSLPRHCHVTATSLQRH